MNNLLEKMQDDNIRFNTTIDEVQETQIDKYNYQMHILSGLSKSIDLSIPELSDILELPNRKIETMLDQIFYQRHLQDEQNKKLAQQELDEFLKEEYTQLLKEENGFELAQQNYASYLQEEYGIAAVEQNYTKALKLLLENASVDYIAQATRLWVEDINRIQDDIKIAVKELDRGMHVKMIRGISFSVQELQIINEWHAENKAKKDK